MTGHDWFVWWRNFTIGFTGAAVFVWFVYDSLTA